MAKIFNTIIKKRRVTQALTGAANFVVRALVGVRVRAVATLTAAKLLPAAAIIKTVATLRMQSRPAVAILRASCSGAAKAFSNPAISLSNRSAGTSSKPSQTPGFDIVRTVVQLVSNRAASGVTEEAVGGRTDWANDANATGPVNGTTATIAGNALGARGGRLRLTYPASVNKTALTITKVELRFYATQSGTTLGNGTLQLGYRLGAGADVVLAKITGNIAALSPPQAFDITGVVAGSWATIDQIATWALFNAALLNTSSAALDAVVIYIEASRTEIN